VNKNKGFVDCNQTGLRMIRSSYNTVMQTKPGDIFSEKIINKVFTTGEPILNQIYITDDFGVLVDYSPIINAYNEIDGVMVIVQDLPKIEEMAMEMEYVKNLNSDLNAILASMYDEILVVNNQGEILRHSDNFLTDLWKDMPGVLVGKN